MNEKPILFSGEMVKAILDGRKTQTRRVIKPQPVYIKSSDRWHWEKSDATTASREWYEYMDSMSYCPYGRPGDLLWVRETWATVSFFDNLKPSAIPKGKYRWPVVWYDSHPKSPSSITRCNHQYIGKRRPSIFMPHWASRITIRVLNVRVERVQDITIDDAREEGCSYVTYGGYDFDIFGENGDYARHPYIMNFRRLWNSIRLDPKPIYSNKEIVAYESYPWSVEDFDGRYPGIRESGMYKGLPITVLGNPWVWVIDFEEVKNELAS